MSYKNKLTTTYHMLVSWKIYIGRVQKLMETCPTGVIPTCFVLKNRFQLAFTSSSNKKFNHFPEKKIGYHWWRRWRRWTRRTILNRWRNSITFHNENGLLNFWSKVSKSFSYICIIKNRACVEEWYIFQIRLGKIYNRSGNIYNTRPRGIQTVNLGPFNEMSNIPKSH